MTILATLDAAEDRKAVETRNASNAFCKVARLLMAARFDPMQGLALAEAQHANARIVGIFKAAIPGGSVADWSAIADYVVISQAFSETLQSLSVFDAALANGIVPAPSRSRGVIVTTGITGSSPSERSIKIISTLALGNALVEPKKSTATIIVTKELALAVDAVSTRLFDSMLTTAVAQATDKTFLAELVAATTPIASAGSSLVQITTDLGALLDATTTHANSRLYYVTSPANMKKLLLKSNTIGAPAFPLVGPTGGQLMPGVTAIASDQIPAGTALLFDATGIAGNAEIIRLDKSDYGTLQIDSAPDSPPVAATTLVSLFQTDQRALRAERFYGFTVLRASAVASLSGVSY